MRTHNASSDAYGARAEINVTPLVDVMLVLLVVFMITAPLLASGIPVKLPRSAAVTPQNPTAPIIISVTKSGETYLGTEALDVKTIAQRLHAQADQADRIVYLRGDSEAPYGEMVKIMAEMNAAGIARLSLVAQADPQADRPGP